MADESPECRGGRPRSLSLSLVLSAGKPGGKFQAWAWAWGSVRARGASDSLAPGKQAAGKQAAGKQAASASSISPRAAASKREGCAGAWAWAWVWVWAWRAALLLHEGLLYEGGMHSAAARQRPRPRVRAVPCSSSSDACDVAEERVTWRRSVRWRPCRIWSTRRLSHRRKAFTRRPSLEGLHSKAFTRRPSLEGLHSKAFTLRRARSGRTRAADRRSQIAGARAVLGLPPRGYCRPSTRRRRRRHTRGSGVFCGST